MKENGVLSSKLQVKKEADTMKLPPLSLRKYHLTTVQEPSPYIYIYVHMFSQSENESCELQGELLDRKRSNVRTTKLSRNDIL